MPPPQRPPPIISLLTDDEEDGEIIERQQKRPRRKESTPKAYTQSASDRKDAFEPSVCSNIMCLGTNTTDPTPSSGAYPKASIFVSAALLRLGERHGATVDTIKGGILGGKAPLFTLTRLSAHQWASVAIQAAHGFRNRLGEGTVPPPPMSLSDPLTEDQRVWATVGRMLPVVAINFGGTSAGEIWPGDDGSKQRDRIIELFVAERRRWRAERPDATDDWHMPFARLFLNHLDREEKLDVLRWANTKAFAACGPTMFQGGWGWSMDDDFARVPESLLAQLV